MTIGAVGSEERGQRAALGRCEVGIRAPFGQRGRERDGATLHREVGLGEGERQLLTAELAQLDVAGEDEGVGGAQDVSIRSHASRQLFGAFAPVSEVNGDGVFGVPGRDEHGQVEDSTLPSHLDDVFILDREARRRARTEECRIAPGQLGEGLGELLQPAVVGETSVVDAGVRQEAELERWRALPACASELVGRCGNAGDIEMKVEPW